MIGRDRLGRRRLLKRSSRHDPENLIPGQHLAGQQLLGDLEQFGLLFFEDAPSTIVVLGDNPLDFLVDFVRCVLAVVLVLG